MTLADELEALIANDQNYAGELAEWLENNAVAVIAALRARDALVEPIARLLCQLDYNDVSEPRKAGDPLGNPITVECWELYQLDARAYLAKHGAA